MKKRILVLLSVVALLVVLLATSVAPAFAAMPVYGCTLYASDGSVEDYDTVQAKDVHFYKKGGYTCVK